MKKIITITLFTLSLMAVFAIGAFAQTLEKIDEYGAVNAEVESARLDAFTVAVHNGPDNKGYVIVYGGSGRGNSAKSIIKRTRHYLVKIRRIDAAHLVTINGGRRESQTVELWLVPPGAAPPTPTVKTKKD